MSKRSDKDYLTDMEESIVRILEYPRGMTYIQFIQDRKTQDAVARNLEVVGEATKKIRSQLKKGYPEVPWKDLAG